MLLISRICVILFFCFSHDMTNTQTQPFLVKDDRLKILIKKSLFNSCFVAMTNEFWIRVVISTDSLQRVQDSLIWGITSYNASYRYFILVTFSDVSWLYFKTKAKRWCDPNHIVTSSIVRIQNMSQSEIIMTQNMSAVVMCEGHLTGQSKARVEVTWPALTNQRPVFSTFDKLLF